MSPVVKVIGRKLAGLPADGKRRTNASWRAPGETVLTSTGRASSWDHHPLWHHAAVTWSTVTAAAAVLFGWWSDMASTATTLRLAFGLLVVFGLWAMVEKARRYSHFREYVQPLSKMLGEKLGYRAGYPVDRISVPTDHLTDPDRRSTVRLPEKFGADGNARKRLVRAVAERLGHGSSYDGDVDMAGAEPVLWVAAQPGAPDIVRFSEVADLAEETTVERPLIGLASRRRPVYMDWTLDSPHALASMGSGAGKSVLGRTLAAHTVRHGGRVIVIDSVKHGASHRWAKGVSGIDIHRQPATAHEALVALAAEVERRCEQDWHGTDSDDQRVLLIVEESNATRRQLQSYWVNELEGKKTSPAVNALADILCVGRQAKVNVLAVGQLMTAQASGGNDARENYGIKVMSRFSRNAARMLVPEVDPQPRSSRHLGRAQVCIGGVATETQIVLMKEDEAIEWATTGVPQPVSRAAWVVSPEAVSPAQEAPAAPVRHLELITSEEDERPADEAADEPIGLREAVTLEVVPMTITALRQARHEDPDFPPSRGRRGQELLYAPSELVRWSRNRQRGAS